MPNNAMSETKRDPRLICECGEVGEVIPDEALFFVACKRDGAACCQTMRCLTEEAAIAEFVKLQDIPLDEDDDAGE